MAENEDEQGTTKTRTRAPSSKHEIKAEQFIVRSNLQLPRSFAKPNDYVRIPVGATIVLDVNFHNVEDLIAAGALAREGDENAKTRLTGKELLIRGGNAKQVAKVANGLMQLDDTIQAPDKD